jgi:DNA-binding transcriptional ArsR family regulator
LATAISKARAVADRVARSQRACADRATRCTSFTGRCALGALACSMVRRRAREITPPTGARVARVRSHVESAQAGVDPSTGSRRRATAAGIAGALASVGPSTVTEAIDRLEDAGLVERCGRNEELRITAAGSADAGQLRRARVGLDGNGRSRSVERVRRH